MPELTGNALTVAEARYLDGDTWQRRVEIVGRSAASVERTNQQFYEDKFSQIIYDLDFLPAGRILRNCGRPRGSLFNCYHIPIDDSREGIGQYYKDSLILWGEGGGVGTNLSYLRPKGAPIRGVGGHSSGPVSFLIAADAIAGTIESGGSRRAAGLAHMNITHPDIELFIDAKLKDKVLSHYNISVGITEEFLTAVEAKQDWEFQFAQQSYGKVSAEKLWDKIVTNMISSAEPGLLNWTRLRRNNSYYFDQIQGVNPCITGDTLIAVADDRVVVPIKELAESGLDVRVLTVDQYGHIVTKIMRNPRSTGKRKVIKLTFNDGSELKCTENHKILSLDGSYIEAAKLKIGDRITHATKYKLANKRSKNNTPYWYWHLGGFNGFHKSEHRMIYESVHGKIKNDMVIHHKNFNSLDNSLGNLVCMSKAEHNAIHNSVNKAGVNNGRAYSISNKEIFDLAVQLSHKYNRVLTSNEWIRLVSLKQIPSKFTEYRISELGTLPEMLTRAAKKAGVFYNTSKLKSYKLYQKLSKESDLPIEFINNKIIVTKHCEICGCTFKVRYNRREQAYCSNECKIKRLNSDRIQEKAHSASTNYYINRQKSIVQDQIGIFRHLTTVLGREPYKTEWIMACKAKGIPHRINKNSDNPFVLESFKQLSELSDNYNLKVVSIEHIGIEEVYNGTVDDTHNYITIVKNDADRKTAIVSMNCGEAVLEPYGVCDLGSIVLPNHIMNVNTNWVKLEETISYAVRFLDNIIEINKYVLDKIRMKAHAARRIGIGVIGLAEYLFAKGLRYGSPEALREVERVMKFIRDSVYKTLVALAIEKGAFPKFEAVEYGKADFIRSLPVSLRMDIKKHGTRCVTGLAIAPTGTISLLAGYSSGIEPLMFKAYKRNDRIGERVYIHPLYKDLLEKNTSVPDWFIDATDLKPEDHLDTQAVVQKYVDGAVSKTVNAPDTITKDELSGLLLEYIHDLKGVTIYVDGSREGQIYNKMTDKEVSEYLAKNRETNDEMVNVGCSTDSCEL